jgi:hypothetical protein
LILASTNGGKVERREFVGAAEETTLSASISNTDTTITVVDGSTFPSGSSGSPFVIVIDRGEATEEKILCTSRTTNTFTVSSRGYDGPPAFAHSSGAKVNHVLDATAIQDMNITTYDNQVLSWMGV